jgi:hypothetical protein
MTRHCWLYLTATLLALAAGCGGSPREEATTGSAQLFGSMAQAITSADVTSVRVTVSAPDMQPRTAELVKTNNQWSGTLGSLPAGTHRDFTAKAFATDGTKLYAGAASGVTIVAKQTTVVSLTLQEVNPAAPFENAAPIVTALSAAPGNVEPGGTVTLNASASDANLGDTRTYAWSAPSGSFAQPDSLSTTWTAPSSAALVPLTLTVTDSKGAQGKVTFNVNVNSGKGAATVNASLNTWPQVGNISASATALEVNESTTVSTTASDNDGDTLAYNWKASCAGTWTNAHSATARFTATALPASNVCNNCDLTVIITDHRDGQPIGGKTTGTFSLCVGPKKTAVFPPDITETFQSVASTSANGTVTFRVKAVDPQGSAMSFAWAANTGSTAAPTTSADASQGVWTAPACVPAGTTPTLTATVSNALGASATHAFTVTGVPVCPCAANEVDRGGVCRPRTVMLGGTANESPWALVEDGSGYLLAGAVSAGGTNLFGPWSSGEGAFVAAYDPAGTPRWNMLVTGSNRRSFLSLVRGPSGELTAFGGAYPQTLLFNGAHPLQVGYDCILVGLTSGGAYRFARRFSAYECGRAATDGVGNVFVVGNSETTDFGGGTVTSGGHLDGFLASYAADGTFRWGKLIGGVAGPHGAPQEIFRDVATDADGNVYLTGHISAVSNFGGVTLDPGTNNLQAAMVVASYTNTGTLRWARLFPRANSTDGGAWSSGQRLTVSSNGIVAVAGNFVGDFDFGGGVLFGGPSQQNQPAGVFVTLRAADGTFLQQRGILSGMPITFRQLQSGPNGDLYAVGNANNVGADFGGGPKGSGPFVARYHGDLSFVSAQVASSGAYPYANAISVRPDGSSLLMGSTLTGINWGFGTGTSAGGQDIWLTWFP